MKINSNLLYNRYSVLFIEDQIEKNPLVIKIVNGILNKVKFRDSYNAIKDFNKNNFDFIIINISNSNELDVMEKIREKEPLIPMLVITNFSNPKYLIESQKLSIFSYISKPYNIEEFQRQISRVSEKIEFEKNQLNTLNKLNHSLSLSREYEQVINESNILSRANLNGMITYVNDKFCEVSGYSKSELMGNSHNIVRHELTPNSTFSDMWNTIKKGEIWKGVLQNKNKAGDSYWVNTTIIPIKDKDKQIVEYMAIRHNLSEIYSLHTELEDAQREIIYKLGEVGETRSNETGQHVKRVAQYSKDLALLYGLEEKEAEILFAASPMHDIGKVGIPDKILKKPSKLTSDEFEVMKTHTEIGYNILNSSKRPILKAAAIVSLTHHEKYDGTGYPQGLKGDEIHLYGRITAVADVFDALGSDRVYKKAWRDEEIIELLKEEKGKHFDPKLIDLFFNNLEVFLETREIYKDLG